MEDRGHAARAKNEPAGSGTLRRPLASPAGEGSSRQRAPLPTRVQGLPPLPAAYADALDSGLAELGLRLEAAAREAIDDHVRLLLAWNPAINLTAIEDPREIAVRHVLDSLAAVPWLRAHGVDRLVDLGSGGGFPGIPLAAAVPLQRALLVESIGKKASFLGAAAAAAGLAGRIVVAADRAEAVTARPADRGCWPAATARAVAPLAELIELAFPLLRRGGSLVAWKRGDLSAELRTARRALTALGGGTLEVIPFPLAELAGHCLVVATSTGPVPPGFPRDPRRRKREPW